MKIKKRHLQSFLSEWVLPADTEKGSEAQLLQVVRFWRLFAESRWQQLRSEMQAYQAEKSEKMQSRIQAGYAPEIDELEELVGWRSL